MRQCRCLYCEVCRAQAADRCSCGGKGGFLDLFGPNQEEGLLLTMDSTGLLKKLVGQFQEHVLAGVQTTFKVLNRVQAVKESNMQKYIQALERQMAMVNAEKEALKTKLMAVESGRGMQNTCWFGSASREHYESFDNRLIQTPTSSMRHIIPRTTDQHSEKTAKRPFSHEAFGAFFHKP